MDQHVIAKPHCILAQRRPAAGCRLARRASHPPFKDGILANCGLRSYTIRVAVTYDPKKRADTLAARGLDFKDAEEVFSRPYFEIQDVREDYGETRMLCFGMLRDRMVVIGYTPRGADRHVFSMRKANDREQARIAPILGL